MLFIKFTQVSIYEKWLLLQEQWKSLFKLIHKKHLLTDVLGRAAEPNPPAALFGINGSDPELTNFHYSMISFVSLLAHRLMLLNWKPTRVLPESALVKDIMHWLHLETIQFLLRGCENKFYNIWPPFINHFIEQCTN